ncbi:MAG: antirestriction protein ArdA [Cyanosarcina radialis HA8281-LM2]|nr:antirestriction protein ArdA [Cyanosarcina radialis HA8281-LM2]
MTEKEGFQSARLQAEPIQNPKSKIPNRLTQATPRIYVACLAAYNNGKLHGRWIDVERDAASIRSEIHQMLASSPEPDAEEWAIHWYENWEGIEIGENEDIERVANLAEMLMKHGVAFAAYCQYRGKDAEEEGFLENYAGEYETESDFAQELWQELGLLQQSENLGIDNYINWEAIARDLFISDYYSVEVGERQVYVFHR